VFEGVKERGWDPAGYFSCDMMLVGFGSLDWLEETEELGW
jgi:hypothetical protein